MKAIKFIVVFITAALIFFGCNSSKTLSTSSARNYGAVVDGKGAVSFEKMFSLMKEGERIRIKVKGKAVEACQKKGCWMVVTGLEDTSNEVFVKFKDYAFFVPKDLNGNTVVMDGEAFVEVTTVQELRHYAKDAGKSEQEINEITSPETTYKFLADGVLILD